MSIDNISGASHRYVEYHLDSGDALNRGTRSHPIFGQRRVFDGVVGMQVLSAEIPYTFNTHEQMAFKIGVFFYTEFKNTSITGSTTDYNDGRYFEIPIELPETTYANTAALVSAMNTAISNKISASKVTVSNQYFIDSGEITTSQFNLYNTSKQLHDEMEYKFIDDVGTERTQAVYSNLVITCQESGGKIQMRVQLDDGATVVTGSYLTDIYFYFVPYSIHHGGQIITTTGAVYPDVSLTGTANYAGGSQLQVTSPTYTHSGETKTLSQWVYGNYIRRTGLSDTTYDPSGCLVDSVQVIPAHDEKYEPYNTWRQYVDFDESLSNIPLTYIWSNAGVFTQYDEIFKDISQTVIAQPPLYLFLRSNELSPLVYNDLTGSGSSMGNIIARIPINASSGGTILYSSPQRNYFQVSETTINQIDLFLTHPDDDKPIDLQGYHYSVTIAFLKTTDISVAIPKQYVNTVDYQRPGKRGRIAYN